MSEPMSLHTAKINAAQILTTLQSHLCWLQAILDDIDMSDEDFKETVLTLAFQLRHTM